MYAFKIKLNIFLISAHLVSRQKIRMRVVNLNSVFSDNEGYCFIDFMHFYFAQNPRLNHFMKVTHHFFEHKQHSPLTDKNMMTSFPMNS